MEPEERQQFAKKIMSPLESMAQHLSVHSALEESNFGEDGNSEATSLPLTRYREMNLDDKNENYRSLMLNDDSEVYADKDDSVEGKTTVPPNHKLSIDEDYASTEKYETDMKRIIVTTESDCANCDKTTLISLEANANGSVDLSKDIDTVEGFQRFSRGLSRSD
jgi:hydroxyacyl-ACP dehydratase HTD2-like protein with hotdog domain